MAETLPGDVRLVVGIKPDSYIEAKGRQAQFEQIVRLSAVGLRLKQEGRLGVMFPIPERGGQETGGFYDQLVKNIGMYRRPGCYHLHGEGDPDADIKIARMLTPEPWCRVKLMKVQSGIPISMTSLLNSDKDDCG